MTLERRRSFFVRDGASFGIFRVAPGGLAVRIRRDQFAVRAIDHVEESVAVGLGDQMLTARVDHHRYLRRVPVVLVVLGELEIPVHLAGVGIQREQGIAVEVVACASLAAIRRRRISRRPEDLIRRRIIGARVPGGSAAYFPRVAFPGVVSRFARSRDGVEAPLALRRSRRRRRQ